MADVLAWSLITFFVMIVVLGVVVAVGRTGRLWRTARLEHRIAPLRPLLLQLAGDEEDAGFALARLGDLDQRSWRDIEPMAVSLLGKVKGSARQTLIELFARRGTAERALKDLHAHGAVRRARAAETLGLLEIQDAFPRLCELLHDRVPEVRIVAARALGRLRDPAAAGPLLAGLAGGRNPASTVAKALVRIGPAGEAELGDALEHEDPLVRATAAQVLGLIGPTPAADRLDRLLTAEPYREVQAMAVRALGMLGTRQALEALRHAAGIDGRPWLQAAVADALGEIASVEALPELTALVWDPNYRVARHAAIALSRLGAQGEAALMTITAAREPGPSAHAAEALAEMRLARERIAARTRRLEAAREAGLRARAGARTASGTTSDTASGTASGAASETASGVTSGAASRVTTGGAPEVTSGVASGAGARTGSRTDSDTGEGRS